MNVSLKLTSKPEKNTTACRSLWSLYAELYVTQPQDQLAAFAYHKSEAIVSEGDDQLASLEKITFQEMPLRDPGVRPSLSITGPGYMRLNASLIFRRNHHLIFPGDVLLVGFLSSIANSARDIQVVCEVRAPERYQGQPKLSVDEFHKEWHFPPQVPKIEMPRRSLAELAERAQQKSPR